MGGALLAARAAAQPIVYTESDRSINASSEIFREDPGGGDDPIIIADSAFDGTDLQGAFDRSLSTSVSDLGDGATSSATLLSDLGSSSITFTVNTSATSVGIGSGFAGVNMIALFSLSEGGLYDLSAALSHAGGDLFGGPSGGASILLERDTGETQTLPGFPFPIPIFETIFDLSAGDSTVGFDQMRTLVAGDYILNVAISSSSQAGSLNAMDTASASFSMSLVPGPATGAALGLGALFALRRRR
jgi:hypothetical protein